MGEPIRISMTSRRTTTHSQRKLLERGGHPEAITELVTTTDSERKIVGAVLLPRLFSRRCITICIPLLSADLIGPDESYQDETTKNSHKW